MVRGQSFRMTKMGACLRRVPLLTMEESGHGKLFDASFLLCSHHFIGLEGDTMFMPMNVVLSKLH